MNDAAVKVELSASVDKFRTDFSNAGSFMKGVFEGMRAELREFSAEAQKQGGLASMAITNMADKVEAKFKPMNDTIGKFKAAWGAAAAVVGAGMLAKKGIDEAVQLTVETNKLARAMGVSATEANAWRIAIGDVYGSTDEFTGLLQGLDRQLKKNEDGFNAMGVATRDANGNLRDQKDIALDALGVLRDYKEGTDRNLAAQDLFGRGVKVTSELLDLNAQRIEDAKEKAEALGEVVGQENVEAVSAYRAAMNDAGDVIEAVWKAVGDQLMPVMTELANFLAENGPDAVRAMKVAVGILATAFDGLAFAAQSAWAVIKAGIQSIGTVIGGFSVAISKAFSGDFAGAKAEMSTMLGAVKDNWGAAYDTILAKAERTRDRLFSRIDGTTTTATASGAGKKRYKGDGDDDDDGKKKKKSNSNKEALRKAAEERKRNFQAQLEQYREDIQAAENNYDKKIEIAKKAEQKIAEFYGVDSKEAKKAHAEVLKYEKEKNEQILRLDMARHDAIRMNKMAEVDEARADAELEYQIGAISYGQRLELEKQFEDQRLEIQREALAEREALIDPKKNPEEYARINNEILALEIEHQHAIGNIRRQQLAEFSAPAANMFSSMEQSFATAAQGIILRTASLRDTLKGLYQQVTQAYVAETTKMLAQKAIAAIKETTLGRWVAGQLTSIQAWASGQSMAIKATETTTNVAKDAVQGGAAAGKAMAGIPYVGPVLALAAMAAIFAAIMSLGGGGGGSTTTTTMTELPSAAGGFDIPAGINPLTQLHEREMVLPAEHADAIRGMAGGGGGGPMNVTIHALDGASVRRVLMDNKGELARALRSAARDFNR